MNYLAHAYLSFQHWEILAGNLISDFVKGKKKFDYPDGIQKGIALHRAIDNFTDTHPATKEAKEIFRSNYRLYSGAFIDIAYDHFVAIDENEFTEESLFKFSQWVYSTLEKQTQWMPERFGRMFPYMKSQNWLYGYKTKQGIMHSFRGLVRRATYLNESEIAFDLFQQHYQRLNDCYRHFWPEVKSFAKKEFDFLTRND